MARLSARDRVEFFELLAHLLGAGMRLEQALELLSETYRNRSLGEICDLLLLELRRGGSLSDGLSEIASLGIPVTVGILRAGERSGNLAGAVAQVAHWARHDHEARSALLTALLYPSLLLSTMVIALVILISYVIPQFSTVFLGADLPITWGTKLVLGLGRAIQVHGHLLLIATIGIGLGLAWLFRRHRESSLRLFYSLPIIGTLGRARDAARISMTLGTLLRGGVPLLEALNVTRDVAASPRNIARVQEVIWEARAGNRIAPLFREILPGTSWGLISAGEESGQLASMFIEAGKQCDQQVKQATERALALIEPAMILSIGVVVGFVVWSLLVPMMQLSTGLM